MDLVSNFEPHDASFAAASFFPPESMCILDVRGHEVFRLEWGEVWRSKFFSTCYHCE